MHQLGLAGMARAFTELEANPQSADLSHVEWLALLLDREATDRYERRLRARLRYARLRHQAAVEDVDYRAARGLDRALAAPDVRVGHRPAGIRPPCRPFSASASGTQPGHPLPPITRKFLVTMASPTGFEPVLPP